MNRNLIAALLLGLTVGLAHAQAPLSWEELGKAEQQILKPYAERWENFSPEQQQRLQKGARRWQRMNSEERTAARERFQLWQQMPAEQKRRIRERFREYQSLPPAQQQRIRKQMEVFRDMPEGQREELLERWQSMSVEERSAVREQMRTEAAQQAPISMDAGQAQGQQAEEQEEATLPEHEGRTREHRMERRSIETPMRRPR